MNNNGMVLISMLLVLLFVSIAAALGVQSTTTSVQLSGNYKRIVQAEQAAKSGIRHVGKLLQDQTDLGDAFRVESLDSFDGARGEASPANYGVDVTRWSDLVWHVESTGHSSGPGENAATCTMSALVKRACYPPMSQMLEMSSPAALVTNGSVTVSGSAYISGLEHLEWPPGSGEWYPLWWGTLAALSYGSITSKGAAEYAGMYVDEEGHEQIETGCSLNDDKKGKCSIDNVVHDEQDPDEIPMVRDPDAVLGLDEADPHDKVSDLREIAKSGVNGSQYVTDPAQLGKGPLDISGVTYVEIQDEATWKSVHLEGSGILVVHNATTTATVKCFNGNSYFEGLVILDKGINLNGSLDVIGSVWSLTETAAKKSEKMINGNLSLRYSSLALLWAFEAAGLDSCAVDVLTSRRGTLD